MQRVSPGGLDPLIRSCASGLAGADPSLAGAGAELAELLECPQTYPKRAGYCSYLNSQDTR